jgi:hypothetical protein
VLLLLLACSTPRGSEPAPRETLHVRSDVTGGGDGSAARPFGGLAHALAEVRGPARLTLGPGRFAAPARWSGDHVVVGAPEATLTLDTTLEPGAHLTLERVVAEGRVVVPSGAELHARSSTLTGALEISGALLVDDLVLHARGPVGLAARGATVSGARLAIVGGEGVARALRAEASRVTLTALRTWGGATAGVQLDDGTHANLAGLVVRDAPVSGVFVGRGVTATITDAVVTRAGRTALLASRARLVVRGLEVDASPGAGVALLGVDARLERLTLRAGADPALTVDDHALQPARVRARDVRVEAGRATAIRVGGGDVVIAGLTLRGPSELRPGDPRPGAARGEDAVVASGAGAKLTLDGATIVDAAGFAVGVYNDAEAHVEATIERPALGGLRLESAAGPIELRATRVVRPRAGSCVEVLGALEVELDALALDGCPEAGVLVGEGGTARLRASRVLDAQRYGVAAFGGGELVVSGSIVRGVKLASFAACGDDASVVDGGDNVWGGAVTRCP